MASLLKDEQSTSYIWLYKNITTKTTTVVKATPGVLGQITINTPGTSDTLTIYDGVDTGGTKIGTIAVNANQTVYPYKCQCTVGITIVSGGSSAGDYTVLYS